MLRQTSFWVGILTALAVLAVPDQRITRAHHFVSAAPLRKHLQDAGRVTVDFGEPTVDVARVEIRRVHAIGEKLASGFETEPRATWSWSNRFDYTIGRVQLSLRGLVSEVDGRGYRSVFFHARRYFGRMPQ